MIKNTEKKQYYNDNKILQILLQQEAMRKLRFKVQNYQRQHNPMYRDNQLWKKKVLNY